MPRVSVAIAGIVLALMASGVSAETPVKFSEPLVLQDSQSYSVDGHIDVARQEQGTVQGPAEMADQFRPVAGSSPSYGFTPDAYWIRITLQNESDPEWFLVLSATRLNDVQFYSPEPQGFSVIQTGTRLPFAQRPYLSRSFVFPVHIERGKSKTVYLRVASSTSLQLPIRVWKREAFRQYENDEILVFGIVTGAHILLLIYNLSIGVFLRSRVFFYYSALVFVATIFYSTTYGFAYQYLWPDFPRFGLYINGVALGLVAFLGAQFTRSAVHTEAWPRIDATLRATGYACLACPLLFLVLPYSNALRLMIPIAIAVFFPILFATIHGVRMREPAARYFLSAMVSYGIGSSIYALVAVGVLRVTAVTQYGFVIGATVAVTIMSIALASQVRALQIDREAAIASNRFKSQFLSIMSHEIRTPLTAIVGMAQLLTDDLPASEKATYARVLRDSGDRLSHLVNQVLDFSRIEEGRIVLEQAPFNLSEMISSLAHLFHPSAMAKGLSIKLENLVGEKRFLGDAARLSQVLMNLMANAVKFTERGDITIRSEVMPGHVGNSVPVRFSIADTGIGVPPEKRSLIFESFVQADAGVTRRHGGSGLGLAIAGGIVQLMGGEIEVEENPGGGVIFSFTVMLEPLLDSASAGILTDEAQQSFRILVAEDDEINRILVQRILGQAGHDVKTAENGAEAVKLLEAQEFDLALVDLQMPEMDGYSAVRLARKLHSSNASIPMYALSANTLPSDLAACRTAGFTGHIAKPYRREDLLEIVRLAGSNRPTRADFN
ncbi:MAG: response regulator [Spirochaetia bacterium]|nr:response regulator [Spirochaetia bacterium]